MTVGEMLTRLRSVDPNVHFTIAVDGKSYEVESTSSTTTELEAVAGAESTFSLQCPRCKGGGRIRCTATEFREGTVG